MTILILILGLSLLLTGANYLVDSSVAIAKRANISNFIIGITIVGMGTSAPELYVSVASAFNGMGDMSVGNVLGSNICNTLLILGVTAIIAPFAINRKTLKRDIPFGIIVSMILLFVCSDIIFLGSSSNALSRIEGIVLLAIFAGFMYYTIFHSKETEAEVEEEATTSIGKLNVWILILIAIVSLGALIYGGNLFLDSAVEIAKAAGMSDSVISITLVAVGTSLPELITCIIAATKGNSQLALGNVIGSNIFNILLILGLSGTLNPIQLTNINIIDLLVLVVATILTFVVAFTFKKKIIDRSEGIILVLLYIAYTVYLLTR